MKKTLIATALFLLSTSVIADRIDDLRSEGKKAYCHWAGKHFINGADARWKNMPLVFKELPRDQKEYDAYVPAIYIETKDLTMQEEEAIKREMSKGWTEMDKYLEKHDDGETVLRLFGRSEKKCMSEESV